MATNAFKELLRLIIDGNPVNASTINRILRELHGNDVYLKNLIESAELGATVFAREQTVEADAVAGMPLYYNDVTQRFERGLAASMINDDGELVTASSTQIWGVLYEKHNSTNADILLFGYAPLDLSGSVDGDVDAGVYYLSGSEPGMLSLQTPPISVPVLQSDGQGNVFVNPKFHEALQGHKHYRFALAAIPAGDHSPPGPSETHEITNADTDVDGWLPADDAIFDGLAPAGARFGYNISASSLANIWPPLPFGHAVLEMHHSDDTTSFTRGTVTDEFVTIDENGIWWMRDCYGEVPWPTDYDSSSSSELIESSCPVDQSFSLVLWFSKMQFQTSNTVVTSLTSADSRLIITCAQDGETASAGDLVIDFDLSLLVDDDDDETGYMVFKTLSDNTILRGPVVEAIAVSGDLEASSTAPDVENSRHQGVVTLTVAAAPLGRELPVEEIRLSGATEEDYKDTLAIGLPQNKASEYRAKSRVPITLSGIASVNVRVVLSVLARSSGDLPDLSFSYRIISRAEAATALPTTDSTSVVIDVSGATGLTTDQYIEVRTSTDVVLEPGDQLLFTVGRDDSGAGDGFEGELHVIDQRVVITGVTVA